jgi:hypothetical protein
VIYTVGAVWLMHYWSFWRFGRDFLYDFPFLPISSVVASIYLSLPIFTTYFALRVKNMIVAAILTWLAVIVSLSFGALFVGMITGGDESNFQEALGPFLGILSFTLVTCFLLRHSLSQRLYSF